MVFQVGSPGFRSGTRLLLCMVLLFPLLCRSIRKAPLVIFNTSDTPLPQFHLKEITSGPVCSLSLVRKHQLEPPGCSKGKSRFLDPPFLSWCFPSCWRSTRCANFSHGCDPILYKKRVRGERASLGSQLRSGPSRQEGAVVGMGGCWLHGFWGQETDREQQGGTGH